MSTGESTQELWDPAKAPKEIRVHGQMPEMSGHPEHGQEPPEHGSRAILSGEDLQGDA